MKIVLTCNYINLIFIFNLNRLLVTSSADHTALIWKTSDFSLKQELKNEKQRWVWDTAFSNDSEHLLTGKLVISY